MKKTLRALALSTCMVAGLSLSTAVSAQDADYVAPEDEMAEAMIIMEVMFPVDTRDEMMLDTVRTMGDQMATSMMNGPIFEDPGIRAIMDEFIADVPEMMRPAIVEHMPSMIKSTAIAYTREFTLEELQDIRAFATTPSGRNYFGNIQSLLADPAVAATNQEFFAKVSEMQAEQIPVLQQKLAEYLAANPKVIERLQQAGVGQTD